MKPIVYVDVIFITNLLINLCILKLSSIILKTKVKLYCFMLSSAIGALYAAFLFVPQLRLLYIFPIKILMSFIMVRIILKKPTIKFIIKSAAVFYLISFTFAGVLISLVYFTGINANDTFILSGGLLHFNISLKLLVTGCIIVYSVIEISFAIYKKRKAMTTGELMIYLNGKKIELTALSDTGNLLSDPISHTPVIIVEKRSLEKFVPFDIDDKISQNDYRIKIRMIPFSSLGKENGMMEGFVPDLTTINGKKTQNVIVAISNNKLSEENEYQALFNPNIII